MQCSVGARRYGLCVNWAALLVAVLAAVAAGVSAWYSHRAVGVADRATKAAERSSVAAERAAKAAEREADAAASAERRATQPRFHVAPQGRLDNATSAIFLVRNDGPQDLDRLMVFRPRPDDGIRYPVAPVGADWSDDEADLGPIRMGQSTKFVLAIGSATKRPEFRVRFVTTRGGVTWEEVVLLKLPPNSPQVLFA